MSLIGGLSKLTRDETLRLSVSAHSPALTAAAPERVTFDKDIAPIVWKNCAPCHLPEEAGPFNLLTYEDVRTHARQIAQVTASRYMPSWLPAPGYGDFVGERRLTEEEIATIARWVQEGEAEGDPRELPARPHFTPGWQLGKPDMVLTMAKPYHLQATGVDVCRNFLLPVPVTTTRYVKAIEIRPGKPKALHHANILVDPSRSCRRFEGHPGDGFPGMDVRTESEVFDPEGHFLFWKPGSQPYLEPGGKAWELEPGTDLVLNMQPSGKPEVLQPSVGLYFTDKPPSYHPMLLQLQRDGELDIPPDDPNFTVADSFTLPMDVEALGVYPTLAPSARTSKAGPLCRTAGASGSSGSSTGTWIGRAFTVTTSPLYCRAAACCTCDTPTTTPMKTH